MNTETQSPTEQPETDAPEFSGRATYSPEDNKLRLYIGRVPRPEYDKLRAEGWKALHKQREAGGGDFVAIWTPERRDTALDYAGVIDDEDMGPAERAADRAERFAVYREKRTNEATGRADCYDAGPSAHGFQSQARAERSAARHDRIAGRACDAWGKAEYWQRRTAGVISHALHLASPSVRMGRIKTIEAELRGVEKSRKENAARFEMWRTIAGITDTEKQNFAALKFAGGSGDYWGKYKHPRQEKKDSLWDLLHADRCAGDAITGAEAAALYMAAHVDPTSPRWNETRLADWVAHYSLRLAYENQMMEAQGGRAGAVEMVPGGWLRGGCRVGTEERQITKVNKSPVTGRVVSVLVRDNRPSSVNHWGNPFPDGVAQVLSHTVEVERAGPDSYRAPTAEELAAFEADTKARKQAKKAAAAPAIPLINPTDADAERLVALWNANRRNDHETRNIYTSESAHASYSAQFKPCEVRRMPQAFYSAHSKGSYAKAETKKLCSLARLVERNSFHDYSGQAQRAADRGPTLCLIRTTGFDPVHVIILTDKPQKPLPASVWLPFVAPAADSKEPKKLRGVSRGLSYAINA